MVDGILKRETGKKPVRFSESYQLLLRSFTEDITSMAVHIKCPVAAIRMKYPVRGKMCKHFQTFDLSNYIQSNFNCKNWLCPICGKSAITLRRCPITEMIIKRADEILPLNKYKNLDEEGLVKLLMAELKKA